MKRALGIALALAVLGSGAASQQPSPGPGGPPGAPRPEDPLARFLFPPELVMQQQRAIGLKPEQRTTITRVIQEFQTKVLDLQWQMQDETQRLTELLDKPTVDQTAALAQIDKLLAVERDVKRAHIVSTSAATGLPGSRSGRSSSHCQLGIVSPPSRVAYSSSERSTRNCAPGLSVRSASATDVSCRPSARATERGSGRDLIRNTPRYSGFRGRPNSWYVPIVVKPVARSTARAGGVAAVYGKTNERSARR